MKYITNILVIIILFSCEQRYVEVPEFEAIESDRVVLIEEMTGVSCPNCPKGTAEVEAIKALYGDQVIPIGIHGIFLAWPTAESEFDLRNEYSRELETLLAPGTSKPAALFNRAIPEGRTNAVVENTDLWSGIVEEQLAIPPKISIEIELEYEESSRILTVNTGMIALESLNNPIFISVMVLENNIIDAQKDLTEVIEKFEHNHVLRTMLTPTLGEELSPSIGRNEVLNRSYQLLIPEEDHLWKIDDLEVVVFVHYEGAGGEVLQAAVEKL